MDKQNQLDPEWEKSQVESNQLDASFNQIKSSPPLLKGWSRTPEYPDNQQSVYLLPLVKENSDSLLRIIGYGLLLFSLFDYIHILIPPQFTNPYWEFQAIGQMVEHIPIPLLGLLFVFYRQQKEIHKLEFYLLRCLSWITLLVGLIYLLMIPLGITNTHRIHNANKAQIISQSSQQNQQLQQLKSQLNTATTEEQIQNLFASLNSQGSNPKIQNPQQLKDQFLTQINNAQNTLKIQTARQKANQRKILLKNSVKWNLGALVSGTLLIIIWRLTSWTR